MSELALQIATGTMALLYHLNNITSYYIYRGGDSDHRALCGTFYVYGATIASIAGWVVSAALEYIYIMLVVVVFPAVVPIVVRFLFVVAMLPVTILGALALLYHLYAYTHYPRRGGASANGSDCGAFYVNDSNSSGLALWSLGAALDCKVL